MRQHSQRKTEFFWVDVWGKTNFKELRVPVSAMHLPTRLG